MRIFFIRMVYQVVGRAATIAEMEKITTFTSVSQLFLFSLPKIALLFSIDNFHIRFLTDVTDTKIIEDKMITCENITIVLERQAPAALFGVYADGGPVINDATESRLELLNVDSTNVN